MVKQKYRIIVQKCTDHGTYVNVINKVTYDCNGAKNNDFAVVSGLVTKSLNKIFGEVKKETQSI